MNNSMFREYDIRALAEEELDDDTVSQIGRAFGTYLGNKGLQRIVTGKDNRLSSERIYRSLLGSILSTGCDIVDIGETTTPVLCYAIAHLGVDGAAMVTGSHNPAEYNGVKLQIGDRPVHGRDLLDLTKIMDSGEFLDGSGHLSKYDILPNYILSVKSRVKLERPIKVVVDCGNGNTCLIAPQLISDLGCDVTPIFCESDGSFPNHHPDPAIEENLKDLITEVIRVGADVGIAYDGDGNRIGVVDDQGRIVSPDIVLGILAADILQHRFAKVVCEVKTSQSVVEYLEHLGGRVIMSRVGYPHVLETLFSEQATLAGELTGHICFNDNGFVFGDAIYTSCRLIEMLSRSDRSLSVISSCFPLYYSTPELRIFCPDNRKFQVVEEITEQLKLEYRSLTIDGIRVFFGEDGWALIRASNTQPALSVRFEARTRSLLNQIKSIITPLLHRAGVDCDFAGL